MTKTEFETTQTTCGNELAGALAKLLARPGWAVPPSSRLTKLVEVVFFFSESKHKIVIAACRIVRKRFCRFLGFAGCPDDRVCTGMVVHGRLIAILFHVYGV